jgi:hypothetical protein
MIIRKFEEKDYISLVDFNNIAFKRRDKIEESIKYRFYQNPFSINKTSEILIAKDDEEKIIGQIMVMPSEFIYEDKVYPAFFGMDYFVDLNARNSLAGVILANKYLKLEDNFGIGLTDKSLAIVKAFNVKLIGYMEKYIKLNNVFSIFKFLLGTKLKTQSHFIFPININIKDGKFIRIFNPEEIISKDGYWNRQLIEFSRSRDFINWRFFYYPEKYIVYKYISDISGNNPRPVYFVVRPIIWKNVNCLLLVDFRFNLADSKMFDKILKSAVKISRKLNMAATITGCSLPSCDANLKKELFFKFGRKKEIVSRFQVERDNNNSNGDRILVTFADSDSDFYYGDNKW